MRILHVDTGREMRGGQRQVLLLLKGLRNAGEDGILLARANSPLFAGAKDLGFPVYPAKLAPLWKHSKQSDVVHVHDARAHTLAAVGSRAPFVVSRRVAFPLTDTLVARWKYRRAAGFLAVSQFVAEELARGGVSKNKIAVVHDGVEAPVPAAEWGADYPAVALASDDPAKGRDLIAEAARLAGTAVHYSTDLGFDLQRASMFVYITRAEGLGSAALLAMAMGIPVIGSDIGGLREALAFGEAGLLTENNASSIAAAMRQMREDSALARTFIQRGKSRVAEYFTLERMVERTREAYRRALAG